MAHDIGFYDARSEDVICYFFGYAQGIFYTAFHAQHCDAGISGSNEGVYRSAEEVRQGIQFIRDSEVFRTYPDPKRIPETLEKLEAFIDAHPEKKIFIHYS